MNSLNQMPQIDVAGFDFQAQSQFQLLVTSTLGGNSKTRGKAAAMEMLAFTTGVFQRSRSLPQDVQAKKVVAPECEQYCFVRYPDQVSSVLLIHSIMGEILPEVTIEAFSTIANNRPVFKYTLTDAIVTHVHLSLHPGYPPLEQLGFVARQTRWDYIDPKNIASSGGFDWLERKKLD